ncbi:MAG: 3-hydroxyacyl-CoA dehydrogenase NAD-binding domain-containing protein [Pseudomonadota bacterium]
MTKLVTLERHGRVAVLRIANPPVNALSDAVLAGMREALACFEQDRSFHALLVHCDGRTFIAGADITVFDDPAYSAAPFNALLNDMEASDRPVVAVLHGTALGGGLEVALACHYRVAIAGLRVGFPEVTLGLLPGACGTQRLPRLCGIEFALDMIQGGRMIDGGKALAAGIVDDIVEGDPLAAGLAYTGALLERAAPVRRLCELEVDTGQLAPDFFKQTYAAVAARKPAYPAQRAIVQALEAAATLPFAEGAALEASVFLQAVHTPQSRALRHLFFAERQAGKIPGLARQSLRPVARVGVLGAGTMGSGIAISFLQAGIATVLVEASGAALERGVGMIHKHFETSVARGKLTPQQCAQRLALLTSSLDDQALADCDLVIEAVFEDLALKRQVCARLGAVCKPGAIIATNTSTLDVDALAAASGRPADFVGMHFFSPANVMRLLEVVRGKHTAPEVLATVMRLAGAIGKVAVVSGVCYGFIGNRMLADYLRETEMLLLEGATPRQIDTAVESWEMLGMAMGPCRMLDMAGVDVAARVVDEQRLAGLLPPDPAYRVVVGALAACGRLGQKSAAGFYDYDGRTALDSPAVTALCEEIARERGVARRGDIGRDEIVERLLYPLISEGCRILQEGIAYRSGDIDVIWTAGYGFPDHRGGPMFMADQVGLERIVARLEHYGARRGNAFGYWTPAPLLAELARQGARVSDWQADTR